MRFERCNSMIEWIKDLYFEKREKHLSFLVKGDHQRGGDKTDCAGKWIFSFTHNIKIVKE